MSTSGGPTRRGLLRATLGGVAGATLASTGVALATMSHRGAAPARGAHSCTGSVPRAMLGIHLWTCTAMFEADMPETLDQIASIGYTHVEHAVSLLGYGNALQADAKAFKRALDNAGLKCWAGHHSGLSPYDDKAWKTSVHDALVIGETWVGVTNMTPKTIDDCKKYCDDIHHAYEVARRMGFKGSLFQHYDIGSFAPLTDAPNKRPIDVVMAHTDPREWSAELDTNHAMAQLGSVPAVVAEIRKFPGRIPLYHFKDGTAPVVLPDGTVEEGTGLSTEFGAGDFGRPDPAHPKQRSHAGFQEVLTAIRETQRWHDVLIMSESDSSQASCLDYAILAYDGLNGLHFPYRARRC